MSEPKYAKPKIPATESERLAALRQFGILDQPSDRQLDDITLLASQICGTPIAVISLVDENRQWFMSSRGVSQKETPRDHAFCAHAINQTTPFVVTDTHADIRFQQNPLVVGEPDVRFYAGAQLETADGHNIGALCVIDHKSRQLSADQIQALQALARLVINNFERRLLEKALHERENFLANVMSILPTLVSYVDRNFHYRYANRAYRDWFGRETDQIINKSMPELIGQTAFEKAKPYMELALQGETQEFQVDLPYLVDGQVTHRSVQAHYIPDRRPEGQIAGFYAVVMDVTQLKQAERTAVERGEQLQEALHMATSNEVSFRAIFDNAPMGILRINKSGKLISFNPAYAKFLGYSMEELKSKTIFDLTHPADLERTREALERFSVESSLLNRFEKRYLTKSGNVVWGQVTSRAIRFEEGGEVFLFSVIEDVTEVRKQNEELKLTQAKLISSAKMASLGEMAGGVAHEINNPLAIIHAKASQMRSKIEKDNLEKEKGIHDLQVIERTADRIAKIVKGLRSFSRNSNGDPMEIVPFARILNDTLELCRERFRNNEIELRINCLEDFTLECRPTEICQIIMNLLGNAYDAVQTLNEKWIFIDVATHARGVMIKVLDSGPGIENALVERIMEPFFTTKEVGKGTGLGLSISKGIAEAHHGSLRYLNGEPNTGFLLELPFRQPSNAKTAHRVS